MKNKPNNTLTNKSLILIVFICSCMSNKLSSDNSKKQSTPTYNTYFKKISEGDSLFATKNYEAAYTLFKKLFKTYTPLNTFRFREYNRYIISKHLTGRKVAKTEFCLLISKHGLTKRNIKNDTILNSLYNTIPIDSLTYNSLHKQYLNSIDMNLRNKIIARIDDDQYYRTYYDAPDKLQKQQKIDSLNEKFLLNLFEKNMFPNKSIIGPIFFKGTVAGAEILLLHTTDSIRKNYFLPKMKKFIHQGKCSPYIYAMMVDQMELYNGRKQIYGTYQGRAFEKNKYAFYNSNRKKLNIGLPSVEFDLFWENYLRKIREGN